MKLIKVFSIRPRKRLGQNFIIKEEILDKIVELCHFQKDDTVVEIGAGLGGLTSRLAARVDTVLAIEKDWKLANLLRTKIIKQKGVKIIHQDALLFDYQLAASNAGRPIKVVGNLPYNIASPLTIELLKKRNCIEKMVLMYQKEVADRLTAIPGNKKYGFLTIIATLYADVMPSLSVGKDAFYPRPRVESTLISFKPLPCLREKLENEKYFTMVVKSAFSQRRKKLRNALKSTEGADLSSDFIEMICRETGIDPNRRGETLTLKEFARLSNHLFFALSKRER
jgi:16S rRNA (adenine1518-N6/adenine1519-N6)-dimethyltransferase